jgi:hypothetical protein
MADRSVRVPLSSEQETALKALLSDVPQRVVPMYDWKSEQGRQFIKALRAVQLKGVPMPWIADALGVSKTALNGAVGYWERSSGARGSLKRLRAVRAAQRRRLLRETDRLRDQQAGA